MTNNLHFTGYLSYCGRTIEVISVFIIIIVHININLSRLTRFQEVQAIKVAIFASFFLMRDPQTSELVA